MNRSFLVGAALLLGTPAIADDYPDFPDLRQFQRGNDTRTIDGTGNNHANPRQHWGTFDSNLLRNTTVSYGDGRSTPAGADRPSACAVSNAVSAQGSARVPNSKGVSDYFWQWGQFLDHDMDLSEGGRRARCVWQATHLAHLPPSSLPAMSGLTSRSA